MTTNHPTTELLSDEQITQLVTDMQTRLDTCSQAGQAYRVKWHEVKSIIEAIQTLQERLAQAKKWQFGVEEREAAVCPEDIGFDEYIRYLQSQLTQLTRERDDYRDQLVEAKAETVEKLAQVRETLTALKNCQNKPVCGHCAALLRVAVKEQP